VCVCLALHKRIAYSYCKMCVKPGVCPKWSWSAFKMTYWLCESNCRTASSARTAFRLKFHVRDIIHNVSAIDSAREKSVIVSNFTRVGNRHLQESARSHRHKIACLLQKWHPISNQIKKIVIEIKIIHYIVECKALVNKTL